MNRLLVFAVFLSLISCSNGGSRKAQDLRLWYKQSAGDWTEALPLGNGRLGAMVFGTVEKEHIQFNEETLWTGEPHDYSHSGAAAYLDTIRQLLFKGKQHQAEQLAMEHFMSVPLRQKAYQPFGDIYLEFPDHRGFKEYRRELDLTTAVCRTTYRINGVTFNREVWISQPDQVLAIRIRASKSKALRFNVLMDSPHGQKELITKGNRQTMKVAVKNGVLHGIARIEVETDGDITSSDQTILVDGAREAVIYLAAATNYTNYHDVSGDPDARVEHYFTGIRNKSYTSMFRDHLTEYQSYFNRFHLDLGNHDRDTLPTDQRLYAFDKDTEDPGLVALYVQYGRYLLISSSRPGTYPANLQGIWNQSLHPPWDSKYTTNINTEMNYWPAEVMNLPDCQDPLFHLIEECAQTGAVTARVHYNCNGWILHHNTDIWRGTAPINHSNHGMWVGGSGWLSSHLWEHFLFTRDTVFLRQRAWPIMREAARFYSEFLIPDPNTGWLISTPSNSPENGGMVAGPTMDHQIIRSLFRDCVEAGELLYTDPEFTAHLKELIPKIAPNQIGQYGQLQEWLED
ncbi:MAG: glycoside hydrolase family 95 protein, partial [Bacteroidales bacterium]|nr:glycoside hydrolase family 95 protein [Bacteroidales bacterium]